MIDELRKLGTRPAFFRNLVLARVALRGEPSITDQALSEAAVVPEREIERLQHGRSEGVEPTRS